MRQILTHFKLIENTTEIINALANHSNTRLTFLFSNKIQLKSFICVTTCIVKFEVTVVLGQGCGTIYLLALSGNVVLCSWNLRLGFSHLHQLQVFLDGCFQVLEVFFKLISIIFKRDVDLNGT